MNEHGETYDTRVGTESKKEMEGEREKGENKLVQCAYS